MSELIDRKILRVQTASSDSAIFFLQQSQSRCENRKTYVLSPGELQNLSLDEVFDGPLWQGVQMNDFSINFFTNIHSYLNIDTFLSGQLLLLQVLPVKSAQSFRSSNTIIQRNQFLRNNDLLRFYI